MASQHAYKLTYFDFRGRGELIRLLFAAAGQKFEDVRLSPEQFEAIKHTLPFGQVPTLHIDGHQFAQTQALANFLSREFGFHGKNNLEALYIEQITQHIQDITSIVLPFFMETDPKERESKRLEVKDTLMPGKMGPLEKLLADNNTGYFVESQMTLADIMVCETIDSIHGFGLLDKRSFPRLSSLVERIHSHPLLCDYYQGRPPDKYQFVNI